MAKFVHVENGVVTNISEGPSDWDAPEGVYPMPTPPVAIGWTYDGEEWEAPTPTVEAPSTLVSVAHWFLRLTNDEVKAFNKLNIQRKTLLQTAEDFDEPELQWLVYWDIFMTHFERLTNDIDLGHPSTIQGLQMFAALAGINEDRLDELLLP